MQDLAPYSFNLYIMKSELNTFFNNSPKTEDAFEVPLYPFWTVTMPPITEPVTAQHSIHTCNLDAIWSKTPEDIIPQAIKFDNGKADWSLMPFEAVEEINKVLEFGAAKYSAHNWKTGEGFKYTRVLNSLLRHVFAFMRGEDNDPESGLSHMAHAGCNVLFILYYLKHKARYVNDDRQ